MTAPDILERLRAFVRGCLKRAIALSFGTVSVLLVLGAVFFNRATVNTVFEVTGQTEIVSGKLAVDPQNPASHLLWALSQGELCAGPTPARRPGTAPSNICERAVATDFEGGALLEITTPLEFEIERVSDRILRIDLFDAEEKRPFVAALISKGDAAQREDIPSPVSLIMPLEEAVAPISMPLVASEIKLGREITIRGVGPQPLLKGGFVQILSRSIIGERVFVARSVPLYLGDVVSGQVGRENELISAIVRAQTNDNLDAIFRLNAQELAVSGLFTEPRVERLNRLDQIRNDNLLAALWSVIGLLVAVLGISVFVRGDSKSD